jgi:hypothetical protein
VRVERRIGSIIVPDVRDVVAKARRAPATCLYCAQPPSSREHILADALGGRLVAKITCSEHNNLIGNRCDAPMNAQYAPFVSMLGVSRSRGTKGAAFTGRSDSGERLVVGPGFHVRRERLLEDVRKGPSGKIKYAKGDLRKLDDLVAENAFEDPTKPVIAVLERPPIVNFEIEVARDVERGVLKTALHFVAGFITDVDRDVAQAMLPYILGDELAGGFYVRTLSLEQKYVPESWPPRHDLRTYPEGSETFVTVLLFGVHGFQVKLPVATNRAMHYHQPLVETFKPVLEENDHVRLFDWDDRLTSDDIAPLRVNLQFRHDKIEGVAKWRMAKSQCRAAAMRALSTMLVFHLSFIDAYKAELQQEAFSADEISLLLFFGREVMRLGRPPWELPIERYTAS